MNPGSPNKRQDKLDRPPNATSGQQRQTSGTAPPKRKPPRTTQPPGTGSDGPNAQAARGQITEEVETSTKTTPKLPRQKVAAQPVKQPTGTYRSASRPEVIIKPQTEMKSNNSAGGRSQSKTDIQAVRPVLKRYPNEEQSGSAKKLKNRARKQSRAKSVTFTEQEAAAAMPLAQTTEAKPATMTGFTELPPKDFLVILGLWSIRFFIPWIDAWYNFNFYLLREPSFWDPLERDVRIQEIIVFSVTSVITVLVSVLADLVNCRFFIFLVLILLFVSCPFAGGILNSVLVARAYNQDFYRKWAFTSDTLFHWTFAIAYISFPIQLSCILAQNDAMSRQAHYNWTAILVFLESVNRYVAFWKIPGKCPTRTFTQSAIWFLIGVIIFTVLLLNSNFALEWAKPEITRSKWHLQEESTERKEQDNADTTAKRRKKLMWFISILTFVVITSFLFATLERLKPDEEWDKHSVWSATSMFIMGEILGTVFMVSVLSAVRWKLQYYYNLPFLRPDVLALGLPHMINFIALVTLLGRFATLSHLKQGDVIVGPIPEAKKMVVEFFNFDYRNRTMCVHSTSFRPLKIGPRQRETREIYGSDSSRIHFVVTLDPRTTPSLKAADSFQYQDNTWATFVITLPFSNIRHSDIQALYSKPEIIRVEGTQRLRPKRKPQIFFMNTFVTNNASTRFPWRFLVKQKGARVHEFPYNLRWQTVIVEVPKGDLEIIYHLVNSTPPQIVRTTIDQADEYSVWAVLLGHSRPLKPEEMHPTRMLRAYKTMETAGPHSVHLPSKAQLQMDAAIMAGMTLAGMAASGIFIGTVYLFWLDTPYPAFGTTSIGVFWVLLKTPVELSKVKVVDIGFNVITALAFLQIVCTVLHFAIATKLYSPQFNFRNRVD